MTSAALVLAALLSAGHAAKAAPADPALAQARSHHEFGLRLFEAGRHDEALAEFKRAHATLPRPAPLFMMAQCEYTLGRLREARAHYEQYLREAPGGEYVADARYRIEAIDNRESLVSVNTVPDGARIRVESGAGTPVAAGETPSTFYLRRGGYRLRIDKAGYGAREIELRLDVAEAKALVYKLEAVPARLEIETNPPGATLFVNGNRVRNPYRQSVAPGRYEIFAEASEREPRAETLELGPAERRAFVGEQRLALTYVQRSGRPELIVASSMLGALVAGGAVAAAIAPSLESRRREVSATTLIGGGAATGAVAGLLTASAIVPRYLPDNRALFVLGGMWIGAAEGALGGLVVDAAVAKPRRVTVGGERREVRVRPSRARQLRAAFLGSLPGLAIGTGAAGALAGSAPSYGRVALLQSAAAGGALAGHLVGVGTGYQPFAWQSRGGEIVSAEGRRVSDFALPTFIGMNVGLAAGAIAAYAPRGPRGPSWRRVALVDLAVGAGALAGAIGSCAVRASECLEVYRANESARARNAWAALAGGALGLTGGVFLTRTIDDDPQPSAGAGLPVVVAPLATERGPRAGVSVAGAF